jgi:type II secretory pathway pseudopilin PulG
MLRSLRKGPAARARGRSSAFTLVEVVFVLAILLTGMGMFVQTITSTSKLGPVNRETVLALTAARGLAERIRSEAPAGVFARYNADPADDPGVAGTAPGNDFECPGLNVLPGDADGFAGEVVFPLIGGELREDLVDAELGFPRDLDGDGIDGDPHNDDYEILPILIRVRWTGQLGERTFDLYLAVGRL